MGCWGITAFDSDAGLDAVDYIREHLPKDGKLELGEIIKNLQRDDVRLPQARDGESHTSPMALAEILVKFMDREAGSLDYDEDWVAGDPKFKAVTSLTASKEDLQWIRDYLSETLESAREDAESHKWHGWFEERNWIGWQEHMSGLVGRLDALLATTEDRVDLLQEQKGEAKQENERYHILEQVCASTPDKHHYLILQAQDAQTGELVWAIGDDQVCAIAHSDFIRNTGINYNDVLIQEIPYRENSPDRVGDWLPLVKELVEFTLQKYMEHDGLVHVYPQWLPEDVRPWTGRELFEQMIADTDHLILYPNNVMDFVPREKSPEIVPPTL